MVFKELSLKFLNPLVEKHGHIKFKLKNSNENKKFDLITLLPLHLRQEILLVNYFIVDLWSPRYSINKTCIS